jgi:GGDEF domain-containing protein
MQLLMAHMEVGRDSALSNSDHSIAHFDTQPPIIARNLIAVASAESPERLERMGAIFLDVDGTKTIVDCTSHSHAGKYLEALAKFLRSPSPRVQSWLQERGLRAEAYAVAGDEFLMVVRSADAPVTKQMLDELSVELQQAIAEDPGLNGHISFDDPEFVMEYDDEWTDEERVQYRLAPEALAGKMATSRAKLPDRFTPSVSCGSATFFEALQEALSPDTEEAKTLTELGINAFRLMVATADARLKADKRVFREGITDPKWKAFLLRNAENRRLQLEMDDMRAKLEAALRRIDELEGMGLVG